MRDLFSSMLDRLPAEPGWLGTIVGVALCIVAELLRWTFWAALLLSALWVAFPPGGDHAL